MTRLFFLLFSLLIATTVSAQQSGKSKSKDRFREKDPNAQTLDPRVQTALETLQAKYELDDAQLKTVQDIQERKLRNLTEIDSLKTSDPALFFAKLESIQLGTQASLQRVLNTPKQLEIYNQSQVEQRQRREALRQELLSKGVSEEDAARAAIGIYIE